MNFIIFILSLLIFLLKVEVNKEQKSLISIWYLGAGPQWKIRPSYCNQKMVYFIFCVNDPYKFVFVHFVKETCTMHFLALLRIWHIFSLYRIHFENADLCPIGGKYHILSFLGSPFHFGAANIDSKDIQAAQSSCSWLLISFA